MNIAEEPWHCSMRMCADLLTILVTFNFHTSHCSSVQRSVLKFSLSDFCSFMDPRIAWCTPEQIGPALKHWLRLWESTTHHTLKGNSSMISPDSITKIKNFEKQQDYIPVPHPHYEASTDHERKVRCSPKVITGDGVNKASTYGLNHSSNLHVLEYNKQIPWISRDTFNSYRTRHHLSQHPLSQHHFSNELFVR